MLPEKDFNKLSLGTKHRLLGCCRGRVFAVGRVDSRTTALGSILGSDHFFYYETWSINLPEIKEFKDLSLGLLTHVSYLLRQHSYQQ